jgi:hypothetical protein
MINDGTSKETTMKKIQTEINKLGINAYVTRVGGNFCVQVRGGSHSPIAWGSTVEGCIDCLNDWFERN